MHRACGTGLRSQHEVGCFAVVQGGGVGDGQPGVVEAPAQPTFRGFQQALLGHFLYGRVQRQVQLLRRYITGNQFQYHIATVLSALTHQYPVIAVLPMQREAH